MSSAAAAAPAPAVVPTPLATALAVPLPPTAPPSPVIAPVALTPPLPPPMVGTTPAPTTPATTRVSTVGIAYPRLSATQRNSLAPDIAAYDHTLNEISQAIADGSIDVNDLRRLIETLENLENPRPKSHAPGTRRAFTALIDSMKRVLPVTASGLQRRAKKRTSKNKK